MIAGRQTTRLDFKSSRVKASLRTMAPRKSTAGTQYKGLNIHTHTLFSHDHGHFVVKAPNPIPTIYALYGTEPKPAQKKLPQPCTLETTQEATPASKPVQATRSYEPSSFLVPLFFTIAQAKP